MITINHAIRFRFHRKDFYLGLIDLKTLIENSKADIYSDKKNPEGYQRSLTRSRSKKFSDYLTLPNSYFHQTILLNARNKNKTKFKGKDSQGTLTISDSLYLVDGQHRAGGLELYLQANPSDGDLKVPVLIMTGFSRQDEATQFVIVNKTQKGIKSELVDRLLAKVISGIDKPMLDVIGIHEPQVEIQQLIAITDALNKKRQSLWRKRITIAEAKTQKIESIKQRSFTESLKPIIRDNYVSTNYKNSKKLIDALILYWNAIKELCPKATGKDFKDYVLLKTTGVFVMNRLFPLVLIKCKNRPTKAKMKNFLSKIADMTDDEWHGKNGDLGSYGTSQGAFGQIFDKFKDEIK